MSNPTPPYIERFRELWKISFDNEPGTDPRTNCELFIAEEIQKARQEGAEEKVREVLKVGQEILDKTYYSSGDLFWADLQDRLTKK